MPEYDPTQLRRDVYALLQDGRTRSLQEIAQALSAEAGVVRSRLLGLSHRRLVLDFTNPESRTKGRLWRLNPNP